MDIKIDITGYVLETDRLILREWKESDLDDFYEYASVKGVGEAAGWNYHKSKEESKAILDMFIAKKDVFAVTLKSTGKVIGSLGIHFSKWASEEAELAHLNMKEIGYVLSKDYWGQGIMPEAVRRVISFLFDECGLDAITVCHFAQNVQSRRVIEKCGFNFHSKGVYFAKQQDKYYDDMQYILVNNKETLA